MTSDPSITHYVISDLHIFDHQARYLFNEKKESILVSLCEQIASEDAQLVMAGDVFDFTGMNACKKAHRQFFVECVPTGQFDEAFVAQHCRIRSPLELLKAVKSVFPRLFAALGRLANAQKLIVIPGNHDCDFLSSEGQAAFAQTIGSTATQWKRDIKISDFLIAAHGDEFDPTNSTLKGCDNPGSIFTSALYQGVLPALHLLGIPKEVTDAVPAVRPEERILTDLEHYLGRKEVSRVLLAFARLMQRNGYFRGASAGPAWFLAHDVPIVSPLMKAFITPARVRSLLPNDEKLKLAARKGAEIMRARNPALANATIVLGHTHELDRAEKYVNLGTWIDHLPSLEPKALLTPDETLPVLKIQNGHEARLYDARGMKGGSLSAAPFIVD